MLLAGQVTSARDLTSVRERLHEIANSVTGLTALDIPGKFNAISKILDEHDKDILASSKDIAATKGAKAAYAIAGSAVGAVLTLLLELSKVIHQ